MIRIIRVLGAALGGLVGLALAPAAACSRPADGGALLAGWVDRLGGRRLRDLPVPHVVPRRWLTAQVQQLSTAEFVTASPDCSSAS